jgi:hypothetical protein
MKYSSIWKKIKDDGAVEFTVHKDMAATVIQGVLRTKSAENVVRKKAGLIGWSELVITRTSISSSHLKVRMALQYDLNI